MHRDILIKITQYAQMPLISDKETKSSCATITSCNTHRSMLLTQYVTQYGSTGTVGVL